MLFREELYTRIYTLCECRCFELLFEISKFHTVDTVHLRHIKLSYRPTDAH
jgi:hypothetical protein